MIVFGLRDFFFDLLELDLANFLGLLLCLWLLELLLLSLELFDFLLQNGKIGLLLLDVLLSFSTFAIEVFDLFLEALDFIEIVSSPLLEVCVLHVLLHHCVTQKVPLSCIFLMALMPLSYYWTRVISMSM